MLAPQDARLLELADLGVLHARGADATSFLQGQLSSDVARLGSSGQLAGLHNPQGRVIALLRLARLSEEDILLILPRTLAAPVLARLRRFVLRAKVRLEDASARWRVRGRVAAGLEAAAAPQAAPGVLRLTVDPQRALELIEHVATAEAASAAPGAAGPAPALESLGAWTLLDIAAGLPQVFPETSESFVAQMLNLDLIGGIAFDKGCYTGQEVIARAHYRGRVKRRMQRFRSVSPTRLAPGDRGRLPDGRAFQVVSVAALGDGRCEFLAVAPLAQDAHEEGEEPGAAAAPATLEAVALELPYALP
ncbi:MAG TPA: hypothetical protein VME21_03400 [Steroidobacteraceae bacterium]|nr:hypothetical protein [Steroidobacteraceae bacterium]